MRKIKFALAAIAPLCLYGGSAQCAETVTYTYDALGRLIVLQTSGTVNNGETVTIAVDKAENRVTYVITGA